LRSAIRFPALPPIRPRVARNSGTGEPRTTATRLLPADQSVYHDAARPSAIILPARALAGQV
jgi:uncharacterized protein